MSKPQAIIKGIIFGNSSLLNYVTPSGYAQLGAMCDDYARGVVEMHGDFETAGTFAHELGHM